MKKIIRFIIDYRIYIVLLSGICYLLIISVYNGFVIPEEIIHIYIVWGCVLIYLILLMFEK